MGTPSRLFLCGGWFVRLGERSDLRYCGLVLKVCGWVRSAKVWRLLDHGGGSKSYIKTFRQKEVYPSWRKKSWLQHLEAFIFLKSFIRLHSAVPSST